MVIVYTDNEALTCGASGYSQADLVRLATLFVINPTGTYTTHLVQDSSYHGALPGFGTPDWYQTRNPVPD